MDVWWFRLPRHADDPDGGLGASARGRFMVLHRPRRLLAVRATSSRKGTDARLRAAAVRGCATVSPPCTRGWPTGSTPLATGTTSSSSTSRLDRLRRWSRRGLLCIGDAAHAMSPVGGVGINLAVQDAVAAARVLAAPLLAGDAAGVARASVAVQRRRTAPTVITQTAQDLAHRRVVAPMLDATPDHEAAPSLPLPFRVLARFPALQWLPARLVGVGALPEHAPEFARRPPLPVLA